MATRLPSVDQLVHSSQTKHTFGIQSGQNGVRLSALHQSNGQLENHLDTSTHGATATNGVSQIGPRGDSSDKVNIQCIESMHLQS